MAAVQKAEMDRSIILIDITTIERKIASHTSSPLSPSVLETQLENVRKTKISLTDIHARIVYAKPDDLDPHIEEYVKLCERLDTATASIKAIMKTMTPSTSVPTPPTSQSVRLPDMQLPSFDGRFEDWPSFEDLFKAIVDNNPSLSPAQKLQYLKSCVKGEPSNMIKSFIITDSNYNEAWQLLTTRYNNKREIVYSLVRKILYQQHLKSESVTSLQTLLNTTNECVRSLKVMGQPTDQWDALLVVSVVEKFDPETKSEWAKTLNTTTPTTFKSITTFLESHIRALIAKGALTSRNNQANSGKSSAAKQASSHHVATSANSPQPNKPAASCKICKGPHFIYQCSKFLKMQPHERLTSVKNNIGCINCLTDTHLFSDCKSKYRCRQCMGKHHTLVHSTNNQPAKPIGTPGDNSNAASTSGTVTTCTASVFNNEESQVLLKTAIVNVRDSFGNLRPCRAFIDGGSEASFITAKCVKALGLARDKTDVMIEGISGAKAGRAQWLVSLKLHSLIHDASVDMESLVIPKVTGGTLPKLACDPTQWKHLSDLPLADPSFAEPGDVDILIGGDVEASIMRDGRRVGERNQPIAQNSIFGWILSGRVNVTARSIVKVHHTRCLDQLVQRFWEVEQVPARTPLSEEESACEHHFQNTHSRTPDGRFVVRLPIKPNPLPIGDTRELAIKRLHQLEKRFKKYPVQHQAYKEFMREYLDLGHMELVTNITTKVNPVYIPHHFVVKEDSSTTKLRVVFDASMKSTSGVSLNDTLMVGPTIQEDLFTLLLRFRTHQVALKADVAKMYRQFEVHEDDRDYQRILWRESEDQPIQEYRLKTVTYGTACAPFLATRCLNQLAHDEATRFPIAAEAIKNMTYVDDLLGGKNSTQESLNLFTELTKLCEAGGLQIRKWCSSSPEVLQQIPLDLQEVGSAQEFDQDSTVKALGIRWKPVGDYFYFHLEELPKQEVISKREILSQLAKTFDPVGWLTPVTITAKILFQDLWKESVDWDLPVSDEVKARWETYQHDLQAVSSIHIPRCVISDKTITFQIHGFADSSEKAYAAAVYLCCELSTGEVLVHLITSRTKVAPLKQTSLPRLELCGAHLLADTIESVTKCFNFQYTLNAWTDSMIVLKWITAPSRKWKTFVANRVAAIQDVLPPRCWSHVRSEDNPADLPSRGISVQELANNQLWWNGPSWLATRESPSSSGDVDMNEVIREERKSKITFHATVEDSFLTKLLKFSSLKEVVSTIAWFKRFMAYLKTKENCETGPLSPVERNLALNSLLKMVQLSSFPEDIKQLQTSHPPSLKHSSKLKQLTPFLDNEGILRVGGRIQKSPVGFSMKHPIILPNNHPITTMIIWDCHIRHYHSGFSLTLSTLRRKYWILKGRDVVRIIVRRCATCKKAKATQSQQLMGNLPEGRVTPHRPFLHAGVDFAGPFLVTMKKGRGQRPDKAYMCVFVCFSTKAVHLDVVSDLSSKAFIACYERFVSRRGISSHLYSDCGTNFIGADRELKEMLEQARNEFQEKFSLHGTTWIFNPPSAPHQGGLWEAAVKSAKYHLRRVVGSTILTLDQFRTMLCNVEACLNSRPLCSISTDPLDINALTPGHFLIGEPLTAVPEPNLINIKTNHLDMWQLAQQLSQHFWRRWKDEYLTTLQQRVKWDSPHKNLMVGDLVVIRDDICPPTKWKLGRVVLVHPGQDGLVRKVTLKTATGEITRPVHKLSVLLSDNEN